MTNLRPLIIALTLLLPACATVPCPQPMPTVPCVCTEITQREFEVVRVYDGDTFFIHYDGVETGVRPAGIDAPEKYDPGGKEATEALEAMIAGKVVRLEFAEPDKKREKYGRLLCYIYVDGVNVGDAMVAQGHAVYREY